MSDFTLNDFRALIGKVNDGNIVFKTGEDGLEKLGKVNYGKVFTHEKTANSSEMNNRVRAALLKAITQSVEGQSLTPEQLQKISRALGLAGGGSRTFDKPLLRRDLVTILNYIDERATFDKMLSVQHRVLQDKGLCLLSAESGVKAILQGSKTCATAEGVLAALFTHDKAEAFNGHTKAAMTKFVNGNLRSIQAHLFDKLFVKAYACTNGGVHRMDKALCRTVAGNLKELVRETVTEMMADFGQHREPGFAIDKLRGQAPQKFHDVPIEKDVADHFKREFATVDTVFKALMPSDASADFRNLRLVRLNRFLASTLKMTCNQAYLEGGKQLERAEVCLQGIFQSCGLDRATAEEILKACQEGAEPKLQTRFQEALLARVDTLAAQLGDIDLIRPEALLKVACEELGKLLHAADPVVVLAEHIAQSVLPGETDQACLKLAEQVFADKDVGAAKRSEIQIELLKGKPLDLAPLNKVLTDVIAKRGQDADYIKNRYSEITKQARELMGWYKFPDLPAEGPAREQLELRIAQVYVIGLLKGDEALAKAGIATFDKQRIIHFDDTPEQREALAEAMKSVTAEDIDFAFHYLDKGCSRVDDNYIATGERPFRDGLRDGVIPVREMTYDSAIVLQEMKQRHADRAMGDNGQAAVTMPVLDPAFQEAFEAIRKEACGDDQIVMQQGDLGTGDIGGMLKLMKNAGLTPKDIVTPRGFFRLQMLVQFVRFADYSVNGILERIERTGGKSFAEMTEKELYTTLAAFQDDPLEGLADASAQGPKYRTVADYFQGALRTSEAGFQSQDLAALLTALRALATSAPGAERTLTVRGVEVRLVKTPTGDLKAVLTAPIGPKGAMRPVAIKVARDAGAFAVQIENAITANATEFDAELLETVLPPAEGEGALVTRSRELSVKVISAKLGVAPLSLSGISAVKLRELAIRAVSGNLKVADLPKVEPNTYNSQEAIELRSALVKAPRSETDTIVMPETAAPRTMQQRMSQPPSADEIRNFLGDLLMNRETWFFDRSNDEGAGERIRNVLVSWAPEIAFVLRDVDGALATVPEAARAELRKVLDAIRELGDPQKASAEKCKALEATVLECADSILATLQETVKRVFNAKTGAEKAPWEKSLGELAGGNGLDLNTPNGRFVRTALETYFVSSGPIEKRAMLSAFLRKTDGSSSEATQVAELLKGAGPILQKMLQGLPMESFGPETQAALKDMKSNLPPIPEEVVKAQLLELKRASAGAIHSIEFIRTIGAATVGQAVLCRIKTKEHPVTGEEVVIKLLRPNVITAAQREYAFFMSVAQKLGNGLPESFQGQYDGILEEMDFTHEAENIDLGVTAYNKPTGSEGRVFENVHSLDRHGAVLPLTGALVLTKVEGKTYDGFIRDAHTAILTSSGVRPFGLPESEVQLNAPVTNLGEMNRRRAEVIAVRDQAVKRRKLVMQFADSWLNEALLGNGFLHGDLHAGNLMTDGVNISVIDYGNALRLEAAQQQGILRMLTSSMAGAAGDFIEALREMLPESDRAKLKTVKGQLAADLKEVLRRGTMLDGVSRLAAALTCVQRAGIGMPQSVTCFIQSLARLKAVVTGLDDVVREAESTVGLVKFQVPERPPLTEPLVINGVDLDQLFETCVTAANGTGALGPDFKALEAAEKQIASAISAPGAKAELAAIVRKGGLAFLESYIKRYECLTSFHDHNGHVGGTAFFEDLKMYAARLKAGVEEKDLEDLYGKIASAMLNNFDDTLKPLVRFAKQESSVSTLTSFEEMCSETVAYDIARTVKKMTGADIDTNQNDVMLGIDIVRAFAGSGGTFGVTSFKFGVPKAQADVKKLAGRLETVRQRHSARDLELRIDTRLQIAFEQLAAEVRLPTAGLPKASDTANLVAVLRANLLAARDLCKRRLGGDRVTLNAGETLYLADVLSAGTNGELAKVLKSADANKMRAALQTLGEDAVALYEALVAEP